MSDGELVRQTLAGRTVGYEELVRRVHAQELPPDAPGAVDDDVEAENGDAQHDAGKIRRRRDPEGSIAHGASARSRVQPSPERLAFHQNRQHQRDHAHPMRGAIHLHDANVGLGGGTQNRQ